MDGAPVVSGLIESRSQNRDRGTLLSGNRRFFRRTHGVADSFVTASTTSRMEAKSSTPRTVMTLNLR